MTKSNNLLVVGGTGFIGHQLVCEAVESKYKITVLSLNNVKSSKKHPDVEYLNADITSSSELSEVLAGRNFNYVVNLGGYINHSKYLSGGRDAMDVHLVGVQNLVQYLDWSCLESFVQIGSSDEYGNHPAPQHESLNEMPLDAYAVGKVAASQLLLMLHRNENFPATVLRLFLVYGPGQDQQRFLPQIITGCLNNESYPVSHGEQLRDFCYVSDVVKGIIAAMNCPQARGEVINLAAGKPVKIKNVLEEVKNAIGQGDPQYGMVPYRAGENMALYADISKAKKILMWEPSTTLKLGISKTIEYYRDKVVLN